jgi:hypothetical protein
VSATDDDDDVIPIGVPALPGKPEAQKVIVEAMQRICNAVGDAEQAASILFTTGLSMAVALGIHPDWILEAVRKDLALKAREQRRPPAPGRRRRIRWH